MLLFGLYFPGDIKGQFHYLRYPPVSANDRDVARLQPNLFAVFGYAIKTVTETLAAGQTLPEAAVFVTVDQFRCAEQAVPAATHFLKLIADNVQERSVGIENLALWGEFDPGDVLADCIEDVRLGCEQLLTSLKLCFETCSEHDNLLVARIDERACRV